MSTHADTLVNVQDLTVKVRVFRMLKLCVCVCCVCCVCVLCVLCVCVLCMCCVCVVCVVCVCVCVCVLCHIHSNTFHSFMKAVTVCEMKGNLTQSFKEGKGCKTKGRGRKLDSRRHNRKDAYHLLQTCSTFYMVQGNSSKFGLHETNFSPVHRMNRE